MSWKVWGNLGDDWVQRHDGIEDLLGAAEPDIVCLVESWATPVPG